MVPLYAARVQDLGLGDVAVFECGACGHVAEIPPSALIRGLGLELTAKILDLERRLRCRLCYAKDQPWYPSNGRRRAEPWSGRCPPPRRSDGPTPCWVRVSRPRANGAVRTVDSARSASAHQDAGGGQLGRPLEGIRQPLRGSRAAFPDS
jgi:hypothetical protein